MRVKTRLALGLLASLAPLSTTGAASAQPPAQPNIIVILADDLGVETLGVYGGTSYETPELDRIAAEGVRFENGHSQPLCTPTRVKLMTGLHNYRNYREFMYLDPADVTFAHVLAQAGYRTVISGKWQLTNNLYVVHEGASPQQAGFDEHRLWQLRREGRGSRYWGPTLVTNDRKETWDEDVFGPDLTNDFVLEAIDEHAAADPATRKALFIYYPMALPHDPFVTTPRHPDAASNQERFAAMVAYMDHLVGRVRAKLVEHELERDTLLLFIGDNGTSTRITSVRDGREIPGGKGRSLQTGSHVPFLAWWPGTIPAGHVNETLVDVGDVFPTLVEAAGAGLPPGLDLDGESLLPMLGAARRWNGTPCSSTTSPAGTRALRRATPSTSASSATTTAACSTSSPTRTSSRRSIRRTSRRKTPPASRRSTPCSPPSPGRSAPPAPGGRRRPASTAGPRRPTGRTSCCSSPTT